MSELIGKQAKLSCRLEFRGFQFISHVFESDAVVKPLCPLAD